MPPTIYGQSIAKAFYKIFFHTDNQKETGSKKKIMTKTDEQTRFAPELHIPKGTFNIDFYIRFGATENFCFRNDDGSIHVAELEIDGAIFHVHETMRDALEPISANGVTAVIGLFVPDVEAVMHKAIQAGATEINPTTDHDYGYRQGMFKDPFGHLWQIQKKI
jgi:PhnB protein